MPIPSYKNQPKSSSYSISSRTIAPFIMTNFKVLLAALPLLASLCNGQSATATEQYDQLCPSKNGQEVETQPGLFVTYNCDKATATSVRAVANSAANVNDCIHACEQSTGCAGSMWTARPGSSCYLVQSTSQPELRTKTQVVYMSYRRVEAPLDQFPDDDEPADQFPDDDAPDAIVRLRTQPAQQTATSSKPL